MSPRINPDGSARQVRTASIFDKVAASVDENVQIPFARLGHIVGESPKRTIFGTTLACVLMMSGFANIKAESRADRLWIPQGTAAQRDRATYEKYFPRSGSVATLIAETKDGSALSKAALTDLMTLHSAIVELKIEKDEEGNKFDGETFADLCVPSYSSTVLPCFVSNVLEAWNFVPATLAADADPLATLNSHFTAEELEGQLGNEQYTDPSASLDTAVVSSAKAVKFVYYLKSDTEIIDQRYVSVKNDAWEREFLDQVESTKSSELKFFASATRSFSDEFGAAIGGDVVLIQIAYFIMIIYLSINLGSLPCRAICPNVGSRVLLSLSSVAAILLSMGGAFGLCAAMGFIWTPVHSVLPFVILGLGVDDSFVIVNAFDQTKRGDPIPKRLRESLAHAATSITVTSLTDFVAFAISTTSSLPALSSFCMYAAVNILLLFGLQVTFFSAALCLDESRQELNHVDCCPCLTATCVPCCLALPCCSSPASASTTAGTSENDKNEKKEQGSSAVAAAAVPAHFEQRQQGGISKFFEHTYCPLLLSKPGKAFTLVAFTALLAICCSLGVPNLAVEDNQRAFVPDGSYLLNYFAKEDKYYSDAGVNMYIVTTDKVDYFADQAKLSGLKQDVTDLSPKYLLNPTTDASSYDNWYDEFVNYCSVQSITTYSTDKDVFYTSLHAFLESSQGGYYNSSVIFGGYQNIVASRVSTELKSVSKYYEGRLQIDADKAVEAMEKMQSTDWTVAAFPWTYSFQTWETFKIIQEELYLNVLLCLVAVLVITTLLIGHPGCSGLVFLCVTMTVADILGCMYFWGLFIDNVSVIQTVIAIGLCVDYAAHVGHCFMLKAGTRDERVTQTLADVGAAVFNGGLSTFLAVLLLSGSKSYVFRVLFQQFFLTVVLGLGHGMILLPVLLSLCGPQCYAAVEARAELAQQHKQQQQELEAGGGGGGAVIELRVAATDNHDSL